MKKLHGYARELAIDEMLDKQALLDKAGQEWGLEDDGTVELYMMAKHCTYRDMLAYYRLRNEAMATDWGFEI